MLLNCSATGVLYREAQLSNPDNAFIYIYRSTLGRAIHRYEVRINNQLAGKLSS